MSQRRAVTKATAVRYRRASRPEKRVILDELCELTGWHRDHGRKALRAALGPRAAPAPRRARAPVYGEDVMVALRKVWAVMDAPAGKRMAPFLPEIVLRLRGCGELLIDDELAGRLGGLSAATIDRRLGPDRARLKIRGRSGTKPGSLLSPRSRSVPGRSGTRTRPGSSRSTWSATRAATRAVTSAKPLR